MESTGDGQSVREREMLSRSPPAQQSASDVVWLLVHTLNSIRTLHSYISKQEGRREEIQALCFSC